MRLALHCDVEGRFMKTISASEPLLAEAACDAMQLFSVANTLIHHIDFSGISPGDSGELAAAAMLMEARDASHKISEQPVYGPLKSADRLKCDGLIKERVTTVPNFLRALLTRDVCDMLPTTCRTTSDEKALEKTFADSFIYFNHFLKVEDYAVISQDHLWYIMSRGAAVICKNNQRGIDLLIPMVMGRTLQPKTMTAILVQVKNDLSFQTRPSVSLFENMSPLALGLFKNSEESLPVVRLVFALASEESKVVTLSGSADVRRSERVKTTKGYTAYDIWCAGIHEDTFNVIKNLSNRGAYQELLHRTQGNSAPYTAGMSFLPTVIASRATLGAETRARREALRRQLNPAVSIRPEHRRNFVQDSAEG